MSVEPTTLERSALERKDRDELTTIVQALGGQIRPRARKAEIVQTILELTGVATTDAANDGGAPVTDHSADTPTPDAPSSGTPTSVEASPTPEVATKEPARSEAAAPESATTTPEPATAETTTPEPATAPTTEATETTETAEATEGAGAGDAATDTDKADGRVNQRGGQRTDQRNGQRGDRGDRGDKGGDAQGDGNEPGNRRRRRRGRNRGGESTQQVEEYTGEPVDVEGLLDLRDEGYGFLRVRGSLPSKEDIYVSVKQARQFGLRKGDHIKGASRPAQRNEKNPALLRIDLVNSVDPEEARKRRKFEDLTPLFPDEKLRLETEDDPSNMTARIVDLISPIGKGQRGLIVSPPKAGKTTIIKQIVRSIETNNPEVKLIVLQVDERPEEVTDMRRWLRSPDSEAVASTFDRPADEHTQVSELTIERAKRLVEDGRDVCIILDGITRLARAYNLAAPATGRIMSGGVDSGALYPPKKFFGAARNVEEGGSLTILGTALIETGSKMDEVIFEEFKGTGNMELRLDRRLSERRVYPAIDVDASSTRHEELLFPRNQLNLVWALRRVLSGLSSTDGGNAAALELLTDRMKTFRTNDEFLAEVAKNRLAAG
jgi:transcription termination factor Rho